MWLPLHNQLDMKQPRNSLQAPAITQSILLSSQLLPTLQAQLTNYMQGEHTRNYKLHTGCAKVEERLNNVIYGVDTCTT